MDDDPGRADKVNTQLSRRAFIKGAGAAAVVAGIGTIAQPAVETATDAAKSATSGNGIAERLGPDAVAIELDVNNSVRQVTVEPRVTLLETLRDHLGLYGTKMVCDRGACGACTVHLDGAPVNSCMILVADARGHRITTIEGLASGPELHPVQQAFVHMMRYNAASALPE